MTLLSLLHQELVHLRRELFNGNKFVELDCTNPKWQRYDNLLMFFHPEFRNANYKSPIDEDPYYVTQLMLYYVKKTDVDMLQLIFKKCILCENIFVYDKLMDYSTQLHLSPTGNRETLTINC